MEEDRQHFMNDDELYHRLRASKPNLPFPAGFQREIWDRIAASEVQNPIARIFSRWPDMIGLIARPIPAVCLAFAMGIAGGLFAVAKGQKDINQLAEARYVKSVSPFEAAKFLSR